MQESRKTPHLIPLVKWNEFHNWPNTAGLRYLIQKHHNSGLQEAIRRVGRKILIDEAKFFEWIDHQSVKEVSRGEISPAGTKLT
ncbi:MAG: hypothetical protein H6618_06770 [Deltaproteobacteria bacterium]|nr:hypothetical protein [Deltaproteobacteria bacterium]